MAEPASTTVIAFTASAMGLTIFGIATGLHPPLLIAGLAGGLWALFYGAPQPLVRRCLSVVMAALVSAWVSPVVASSLQELPFAPKIITHDALQFPVALIVGFLAMAIVGPGLMALSLKRLEDASK